jgi:hypothetical protein
MSTIYILAGSDRCYDDGGTYNIKAYSNKKDAERDLNLLRQQLKDFCAWQASGENTNKYYLCHNEWESKYKEMVPLGAKLTSCDLKELNLYIEELELVQ